MTVKYLVGAVHGAAVVATLLVASTAHAQSAEIRGRVVAEDGAPISGATVQVEGASVAGAAVTDVRGQYVIRTRPGAVEVSATAMGYEAAERQVAVAAGAGASVDFTLRASPVALSGLLVSATRSNTPIHAIPGAVTVVGRQEIDTQAKLTPDLASILSQTVPGLAAGNESMSIYGQSLRGRNVAVLIDGVPQSTSRNVMRDFSTIDPSAIERVEVIRGATSIYGDGATGGVINIVTRSGSVGPTRYATEIGLESSATNVDGSLSPRVVQSVSGSRENIDFAFTGSLARTGGFYDAEGDLIPADPHGQGGVAEMNSWNLLGKLGTDFGAHRFQVTVNRFSSEQDTDFTTDPSVVQFEPGTHKARTVGGLQLAENQGADNLVGSLEYRTADLAGSEVRGQIFYRDYLTRFSPFDGRRWYGDVIQSFVDSEKFGGRLELQTPLPIAALPGLTWGVDYVDEESFQGASLMDAALYDQSGGMQFRKTGEKVWVPLIRSKSLGLFAQGVLSPISGVEVRGGVRHERVELQVEDFTTITGNPIRGGAVEFDPVLFNLGTVVSLTDAIGVYGNYSEGFSLSDVGRALRGAAAGTSIGDRTAQPQEVQQYELGVRGLWARLQATATAFQNESDLGTNLNAALEVVRAPERVRGVETTLDVQPNDQIGFGGTFTWNEGESYVAASDSWTPLNGYRIQPLKVTGYAEHRTAPNWTNRFQALYSGNRDRAFEANPTGYGNRAIDSYWVIDYLGVVQVGPGALSFGVQNLFNRQYFPTASQLLLSGTNTSYAAARGATLNLGYSVTY